MFIDAGDALALTSAEPVRDVVVEAPTQRLGVVGASVRKGVYSPGMAQLLPLPGRILCRLGYLG